jgi:hypothetical protein
MRRYVLKRIHLDLAPSTFTDPIRDDLLAAIAGAAPTSTLIQNNPAMVASVAALATKGATFRADRDKVANAQQQLDAAFDTSNTSRASVDLELMTLGNLVATNAKTKEDVTKAGFKERGPKPPEPSLEPPVSIDFKFPKRLKGQVTATPHVPKGFHAQWAVEMSTDPIGANTWVTVHGTGKSRVISAPSGSKVWVRYAMVRGQQQSAWGEPQLVTIP